MAIQTLEVSRAIEYLESTIDIPVHEMSRAMYKLLGSCARVVQRNYPGMAGYYDHESSEDRIDLQKHLHWRAHMADIIPQSPRLLCLTTKKLTDPWADSMALFCL